MTGRQMALLSNLEQLLYVINDECEHEREFNKLMSELDLFNGLTIDQVMVTISEVLVENE